MPGGEGFWHYLFTSITHKCPRCYHLLLLLNKKLATTLCNIVGALTVSYLSFFRRGDPSLYPKASIAPECFCSVTRYRKKIRSWEISERASHDKIWTINYSPRAIEEKLKGGVDYIWWHLLSTSLFLITLFSQATPASHGCVSIRENCSLPSLGKFRTWEIPFQVDSWRSQRGGEAV